VVNDFAARSVDENLAARPRVTIEVSVRQPTGRGSRDPGVLLTKPPFYLDGQPLAAFLDYRQHTYDTYDGHNHAAGPDWYAVHFPVLTRLNCIEMTMECPNRDGGWWTSLWVEAWNEANASWEAAANLLITPPYSFANHPSQRRL
jgi:hypothetical protein